MHNIHMPDLGGCLRSIGFLPLRSVSGLVEALTESASLTGTDTIEQEMLAFRRLRL